MASEFQGSVANVESIFADADERHSHGQVVRRVVGGDSDARGGQSAGPSGAAIEEAKAETIQANAKTSEGIQNQSP